MRGLFSLPRTGLGRLAAALFVVSVPLYLWAVVFGGGWGPNLDWLPRWLEVALVPLGVVLLMGLVIVLPASGVVSAIALGAGERSLLVWLAQIPTVLFVLGLLTVFEQRRPLWQLVVGVLTWVAIAAGLGYLTRQQKEES